MNTPPAASADGASGCDVLVIGGELAGSTAAALLADEVFGKAQIYCPLRLFKGLYYAACLLNFRRTLKAWQMHKYNIRVVDEAGSAMN